MNWWMVPAVALACFLVAFLVGLFAALVAGSRYDDEVLGDRQYEDDPWTGI